MVGMKHSNGFCVNVLEGDLNCFGHAAAVRQVHSNINAQRDTAQALIAHTRSERVLKRADESPGMQSSFVTELLSYEMGVACSVEVCAKG
jgi:hypothetical protein